MRMRKGRTEVSGRTPIVRELLRFDPASFYSRVMFMEINSAAAIHSIEDELSWTAPTVAITPHGRWMNSHESPSVRWFYPPKEDKMKAENDASRVSIKERGRPSFLV